VAASLSPDEPRPPPRAAPPLLPPLLPALALLPGCCSAQMDGTPWHGSRMVAMLRCGSTCGVVLVVG
jgi:hypothetical protein